jgi:hypothetical protein
MRDGEIIDGTTSYTQFEVNSNVKVRQLWYSYWHLHLLNFKVDWKHHIELRQASAVT